MFHLLPKIFSHAVNARNKNREKKPLSQENIYNLGCNQFNI